MGWWNRFVRGGSPWSDPVLENRHVDAARFQAPFLRALESLVRSHPEVSLRPHLSSIEPTFADYKANVRDLAFGHPDLPDRMLHVLSWASVPPAAIRGHYHEARRQSLRHLP